MSRLDALERSRTPGLYGPPASGGAEVTGAEGRATGDMSGHDCSQRGWRLVPVANILLCQPTLLAILGVMG